MIYDLYIYMYMIYAGSEKVLQHFWDGVTSPNALAASAKYTV